MQRDNKLRKTEEKDVRDITFNITNRRVVKIVAATDQPPITWLSLEWKEKC
jgi:hypothetical protein